MIDQLKHLLKHSFIYRLSNVAAKAVGVFLIPLYTIHLTVHDFGSWDLVDVTVTILAEILMFGQASAIMMLNNAEEFKGERKSSFYTISIFILIICLSIVIVEEILTQSSLISMFLSRTYTGYLRVAVYIVLFRVLTNLFLAKLRADELSGKYTAFSIIRIFIMTIATIYFVAFAQLGVIGILWGALIAEIIVFLLLLPRMIKNMTLKFNKPILVTALKFGFPLVFGALGFMLLNMNARYLIKILLNEESLGLYGLGYRIGGVLNMLLILPFNLTLLPIAYKMYKQPGDKEYFSKIMTYSSFVIVWGCIFLSLFSEEIIKIFAPNPDYWASAKVVPLILLAYVFSGMRLVSSLGMLLTKNTKYIALTTLFAAVLNIILNLLFIPKYGIMAAAVNTLIAFIIFYVITQMFSDKYYKIPFENSKLFKMIVLGILFSCVPFVLPELNLMLTVLIKFLLLAIFPFLLYLLKFYEKSELQILTNWNKLSGLIKKLLSPADDSKNINV